MLSRRLLVRLAASVLVAASTLACMSWRVQDVTPTTLVTQQQPVKVRVSTVYGKRIVLHRPMIAGDTIYGTSSKRTAVAVVDVVQVAVQKFNPGMTLIGTVGVAVGVYAGFALLCEATDCLRINLDFGGWQ